MESPLPRIGFDEHLARFLFLTLILTLILTELQALGEVFMATVLTSVLLILYTAIQGFWYGYLEGKLKASQ